MGITGLNINLTVGSFTVNRLPKAELILERGAVAERLVIGLPDPAGQVAAGLAEGEPVDLFFGFRGGPSQSWSGEITEVRAAKDAVRVTALAAELAFVKTKVSECFHQESARKVVTRLMNLAGVSPGRLEGPDEVIPHLIFSGQPVYECFKQINATLARVYQLDMSAMVYWIDSEGSGQWGDFDRPGPAPVLASGDNLIKHDPKGEDGEAAAILCPGLNHSQLFSIRDDRRSISLTKRAQSVRHILGEQGNLSLVAYGQEKGYD
jgi:hypothetical protein